MDILEKAIKHYGPQNQMMMVLEENAELSQAITKYIHNTLLHCFIFINML